MRLALVLLVAGCGETIGPSAPIDEKAIAISWEGVLGMERESRPRVTWVAPRCNDWEENGIRIHVNGCDEMTIYDDGSVYFRIFVKPLVNLLWLAGLIFVLGSIIALWPDAREQRR